MGFCIKAFLIRLQEFKKMVIYHGRESSFCI